MGQSPAEQNQPERGRSNPKPRRRPAPTADQQLLDFLAPWVPIWIDLPSLSEPEIRDLAFQGFASLIGDDISLAESFAWQMQRCYPNHAETSFAWASLHMIGGREALAYRLFTQIPASHKLGLAARASARDLQRFLGQDWECLAASQEAQFHMARGALGRAEECAREVLKKWPDDLGARVDLSTILFHAGQREEMIELCRQVVSDHPEHFSAVANLFSFLYLTGQIEEALPLGQRLRAWKGDFSLQKAAECAALQGDDRGVLEYFRQAVDVGRVTPLLYHLAAVAQARKNQWRVAIDHWQQALELNPDLEVAQENLLNAGRPKNRRHSSWPFPLEMWVSRRQLEENADLNAILPMLLDRGDPQATELAAGILLRQPTRQNQALARHFLASQRGTAHLREVIASCL